MDPKKIASDLRWLGNNPEFYEKPATLQEFLGVGYLQIEDGVRPGVRDVLVEMVGNEVTPERITKYPLAMFTGGIGIGKTTIASIILPYLCHWVMCLKDPQRFFGLLPGSRIAFMQMSTSEPQAREVIFGDIKARIRHSPWFQNGHPIDPNYKNQIRFDPDIWILPGDSAETTFEGYNILGGILDEADSHKATKIKDYAEVGFDAIQNRISSRFGNRGFLLVIGQMKKSNGFAYNKFQEINDDPTGYAARMTIWESKGWQNYLKPDGTRDSFWYDIKRKQIVPAGVAVALGREDMIEVPTEYVKNFTTNPEKALRDLAGIPPAAGDPFISLTYKIEEARDRWVARNDGLTSPLRSDGTFEPWFRATDSLKRVLHMDIAYSAEGDALGLAMGHVREVVTIDGENKPYIVFDLLMRIKAPPGGEIMLADVRRIVYMLRDDRRFRIDKVTLDGFQSTDTRQQLTKRRIPSEIVSVDKSLIPYYDLRDALYEDRIEFPQYMVKRNIGDTKEVEILQLELSQLEDQGLKIDHPPKGSKDVADCLAGVTFTLMGDRRYRRSVVSLDSYREEKATGTGGYGGPTHPALGTFGQIGAPLPPSQTPGW